MRYFGVSTRGNLQTLVDMLTRPNRIPLGQLEFPKAGKKMRGVAPLHPITRCRIAYQTVNALEKLLG